MKILVINCGSSSLKYQLIDMDNESVVAKGLCERIGIEGSKLTHQPAGKDKYVVESPMPNHTVAINMVMEALQDKDHGVIASTDEISAIGHRVLHAGVVYSESVVVNEDVKRVIRECFDLGPLHNPANLMGIEACEQAMPGKPNVAVWDTGFGMSMPEKAYMYAIPHEYYEKYSIRRLVCSIRLSIRPCRIMRICMVCLTRCTRNMAYVVMASTEPAICSYPAKQSSSAT